MRKKIKQYSPVLLAVVFVGCHSVIDTAMKLNPDYTTVPIDALREVANEIEGAVSNGERTPNIRDRGGIVLSTDDIKSAIRARAARSELLNDFLDAGYGYERANGLLYQQDSKQYKNETGKNQKSRHALLVYGENKDRWALYEGIVKASGFSGKSLDAVRKSFFDARLSRMRDGQLYKDENRSMQRK